MTNGGSKGSKSEKQVEGDTDLRNHILNLVNLNHPGVLNHLGSLDQGQRMNRPLLKYALGVRENMMKKIVKNSYIKKKERRLYLPNQ